MTLTQVMDHYALAFGQQPQLRPHGLYPCGGCGGSFPVGEVCIVLSRDGNAFVCSKCSRGRRVGARRAMRDVFARITARARKKRNAEILRRVEAGEAQAAVARALGLSRQIVWAVVRSSRRRRTP